MTAENSAEVAPITFDESPDPGIEVTRRNLVIRALEFSAHGRGELPAGFMSDAVGCLTGVLRDAENQWLAKLATAEAECARVLNDLQQSHVREISAARGELERARETQRAYERITDGFIDWARESGHLEAREKLAELMNTVGRTDWAPTPAPAESVNPMSPDGDFTIQLSEYHVVNLRELIKCCGVGDGGAEPAGPSQRCSPTIPAIGSGNCGTR